MLLGLIARLRRHRRSVVTVAAGLLIVQALLSGLALAQATVTLTDSSDTGGFGVICHGKGGARPDVPAIPDPAKNQHPCCESCAAGASPAALPGQLLGLGSPIRRSFDQPFFAAVLILIVPRAVRAGASQAPPTLD